MQNYSDSISTLIGSLNTDSTINYSDYALIKSGGYKKLLKAYYDKDSKLNNTDATSSLNEKINAANATDSKGVAALKASADELKKTASSFSDSSLWKEEEGKPDMEKIASSVKAFVSDYNDVVTKASKAESQNVSNTASWMTGMTDALSNTLSKVGITVGSDNKLSFDEDAFMKADTQTVKTLFADQGSFASQIADKAGSISSAALNSAGLYSADGTINSQLVSLFNQTL